MKKARSPFLTARVPPTKRPSKPADTIAGYKLTAIAPDAVKLARETNEVELTVGMQMRRDEEGGWRPAKSSATYAASGATTSGPANTAGSATSPQAGAASSGSESDVIKRMMQRREKE